MTIAEYLALENGTIEKHNITHGEVVAMFGIKATDNRTAVNALSETNPIMKGKKIQSINCAPKV